MVDFRTLKSREVKVKEIELTFTVKLHDSLLEPWEIENRARLYFNNAYNKNFSGVVNDLMSVTKVHSWDLGAIQVKCDGETI